MIKIMFICTGNICRSAMAEAILKEKIQKDENLSKAIEVYSSGIYAEDGDAPTYTAIETMKEYKIDMTKHKATNISNSNIQDMDLILCATNSHKRTIIEMYPKLKEKVYTIKEYAEYGENDVDIKDPWGYDIEIYRFCATEIEQCIDKILTKIEK